MSVKPLPNESELLRNIAEGNQYAFTVLYKHYQGFVNAFGRKLTYSNELAGEIVQDIFLKIWLNREKLAEVDNFGAYLNRLVRNQSFNVLRQIAQDAKSNARLQHIMTETDESTSQLLSYNETAKLLDDVIGTLSAQQRMAYNLCHVEGMKYEEAAEKMNITPETVHSHMKRALKKIRDHFKKHAVAYPVLIALLFK